MMVCKKPWKQGTKLLGVSGANLSVVGRESSPSQHPINPLSTVSHAAVLWYENEGMTKARIFSLSLFLSELWEPDNP